MYQGNLYKEVFLQCHRVGKTLFIPLNKPLIIFSFNCHFVMEGFVDKPHRDAKDFHVCTTGRTQFFLRHLHKRSGAKPLKHTPENPAALFYCSREADKF